MQRVENLWPYAKRTLPLRNRLQFGLELRVTGGRPPRLGLHLPLWTPQRQGTGRSGFTLLFGPLVAKLLSSVSQANTHTTVACHFDYVCPVWVGAVWGLPGFSCPVSSSIVLVLLSPSLSISLYLSISLCLSLSLYLSSSLPLAVCSCDQRRNISTELRKKDVASESDFLSGCRDQRN